MTIHEFTDQFEIVFQKQPWYGASVMEVVASVPLRIVGTKITPRSHSVYQIVMHMITWREYVTKKLSGQNDYAVEVGGELDWPFKEDVSKEDWNDAVAALEKSQLRLIETLKRTPDEKLEELVPLNGPNTTLTFGKLLHGLLQHDVYHAGQIALLRNVW
jgi:uncharacterized damage-inducible protein DinB